jgi:hypothetical protein
MLFNKIIGGSYLYGIKDNTLYIIETYETTSRQPIYYSILDLSNIPYDISSVDIISKGGSEPYTDYILYDNKYIFGGKYYKNIKFPYAKFKTKTGAFYSINPHPDETLYIMNNTLGISKTPLYTEIDDTSIIYFSYYRLHLKDNKLMNNTDTILDVDIDMVIYVNINSPFVVYKKNGMVYVSHIILGKKWEITKYLKYDVSNYTFMSSNTVICMSYLNDIQTIILSPVMDNNLIVTEPISDSLPKFYEAIKDRDIELTCYNDHIFYRVLPGNRLYSIIYTKPVSIVEVRNIHVK